MTKRNTSMDTSRVFRVVYELDGALWLVNIPDVPGCHSYGRSLAQARSNIREALAASLDDEDRDAIAVATVFEEEIRTYEGGHQS